VIQSCTNRTFTEQSKNDHCLRESEHTEQAAADQQREQNSSSVQEQEHNICIVKNELCELSALRHILYDTYIVVVVVVAAELVVQESVLTYSIKKDFTYKRCE
jgi:UDP-glucose 4-epimerase